MIPVRNLWLLMLYVSDLFRTGGIGKVGLEVTRMTVPVWRRKCWRTPWKCVNVVISALDTDRAMPISTGFVGALTCSPQSGTNCLQARV